MTLFCQLAILIMFRIRTVHYAVTCGVWVYVSLLLTLYQLHDGELVLGYSQRLFLIVYALLVQQRMMYVRKKHKMVHATVHRTCSVSAE